MKALGALSEFTVGLFNPDTKQYDSHTYHELTEITSLWGTVTTREGEHYARLHLSAAGLDNRALGGHMSHAVVGGTCEMVLDVVDGTVERQMSDEIGLNLFSNSYDFP
ncbi:MAG: PPC domain-containing DNA-binding protein [Oscillospiraceae bacterium]